MNILLGKKGRLKSVRVFTPIPSGQVSTPIEFRKDLIFFDAPFYKTDDTGNKLTIENLADHSTINNINGVPTGVPANLGTGINMYGYKVIDWYNIGGSWKLIFDLQGEYNLDYAYIYVSSDFNPSLEFLSSYDGLIYEKLTTSNNFNPTGNQWIKIDFNITSAKAMAKYFIIGIQGYESIIRSVILYGRKAKSSIVKGVKFTRKINTTKTNESIGTNGFYFEKPKLMSDVSGCTRFYVEPDWFIGDDYRRTGSAIGKTPDDINYRFNNSHMGSIDQLLQSFANYNIRVMFTTTTTPVMLRSIGTGDAGHAKPIDPGLSTTKLIDTTNPMNYKFMARMAWNIAARYGQNRDIDLSLINLQPTQNKRVGLGLIYAMEVGNEIDKWWLGAQAYTNPEEMAAYLSAIYDGHMGAMGSGYGIKVADPSMKVSMISLASGDNTSYVRKMLLWFDKYRGKGNYAFDLINYHYYNSSEGSQEVGNDTAYGLPPEQGDLIKVNQSWSELRDAYCSSSEVWLTEVGWDEHLGGVFSPRYATQALRSLHKAYWLSRLFIINNVTGVDVTNQYWYATTGGQRLAELPEFEPNSGKFISQGLVEGVQSTSDWNRKPLTSYWYVGSLKKIITGFTYSHVIVQQGVKKGIEDMLITQDNDIWMVGYINYVTNKKYIAIWLASTTLRVLNVSISLLNNTKSDINVYSILDAHIRKSLDPLTIIYPVINNTVSIDISECLQFMEVDDLGTAGIIQPINILNQLLNDKTKSLITWTDKNINQYDVRVSKSLLKNEGYVIDYQGPIESPEHIVSNLQLNTTYYYKVELIPNGAEIIEPSNPDTDLSILNEWEKKASNIYYAAGSRKINTNQQALDKESVGVIIDRKGTLNMEYVGVPVPAYSKKPPILRTTDVDRPYIIFENEPHTLYASDDFPITGVPHAITLVMEYKPGQDYEVFIPGATRSPYNVGNGELFATGQYLGNSGVNLRAGAAGGDHVGENTALDFLIRRLVHIEFKADTIDFYIDGVLRDTIPNDVDATNTNKKRINALGVDTNNACWNFFAMYQYYGIDYNNMTITRGGYFNSMITKWNIGQSVPNPHTINLTINEQNNVFIAVFTPINATQQEINNSVYKWVVYGDTLDGDGGNFNNQTVVGTADVITRDQIIAAVPDITNRRRLTVFVNVGNVWDYVKGASVML